MRVERVSSGFGETAMLHGKATVDIGQSDECGLARASGNGSVGAVRQGGEGKGGNAAFEVARIFDVGVEAGQLDAEVARKGGQSQGAKAVFIGEVCCGLNKAFTGQSGAGQGNFLTVLGLKLIQLG